MCSRQNMLFGNDSPAAKYVSHHDISFLSTPEIHFNIKAFFQRRQKWILALGGIVTPYNSSVYDRSHFQIASLNCK